VTKLTIRAEKDEYVTFREYFVDQINDQPGPEAWPSNPVVGEVQLGVRLWKRFYAIGEYRVNQKCVGDEENFAAGIEYKVRW
jgi:hypothetical protein